MLEFYIALKYILKRKKQSFVSIMGIIIGISVLTISIGISNGLDKNMINSILSLTSHVIVMDNNGISDYKDVEKQIMNIKGVKGTISAIESQGIIKYSGPYGNYVSGVKINGYDLEQAKISMNLEEKIVSGKVDTENINSILIGNELSKATGMSVGETIKLISSENQELEFKVSGIFQSGYYDYDISMVILPLKAVQYMAYKGDVAERILVDLDNPYNAPNIKNDIQNETGYYSRTWGEINKSLLSALSLEKTVMIVVFSLIVVIAGFVVWVTLNTLVREKIKDIGIMGSMGFSKFNIMKIFLIQGVILGFLGILIGVIISLAVLWWLTHNNLPFITSIYYLSKIPIEISTKEVLMIISANVVVIFISSIFPSYRAAKMENVEALRHE